MHILITGGAGFIGQHLASALVDRHKVTAMDLLHPQVHLDPQASSRRFPGEVIVADISEESSWEDLRPFDAVIHLAAETGTGQSMYERDRYHRVNVEGSRLVANAAVAWGVPLVNLSSRAVYGEGRYDCDRHGTVFGAPCCSSAVPEPSKESDPHQPVSYYGETKSLAEVEIQRVADGVPITIIRPQNVVGPGQALHNPYTGVLAAFLARLKENLPLLVYGDGSGTRDFIHVADLANLIVWATEHPPTENTRVLNAGVGYRTSLRDLANSAASAAPHPVAVEHVDVVRAGDIAHACADMTYSRELGVPEPGWSSADAVRNFIEESWGVPGASSEAWDVALGELKQRGLTK